MRFSKKQNVENSWRHILPFGNSFNSIGIKDYILEFKKYDCEGDDPRKRLHISYYCKELSPNLIKAIYNVIEIGNKEIKLENINASKESINISKDELENGNFYIAFCNDLESLLPVNWNYK